MKLLFFVLIAFILTFTNAEEDLALNNYDEIELEENGNEEENNVEYEDDDEYELDDDDDDDDDD
ncbi:hypothetical protein KM1_297700, partial [Entamoeba histolytica HM-3:IMSS]